MLGDSKKLNMLMNDELLVWRYLKSEGRINTLVYANNSECFSEEFLKFVGWDAVMAKKEEPQKQEPPKKQERTQKQEGAPKQGVPKNKKAPKSRNCWRNH